MTFLVLNGVFLTCFFCLGKAFFESVICRVIHSLLPARLYRWRAGGCGEPVFRSRPVVAVFS
jgi:hypothetical protein